MIFNYLFSVKMARNKTYPKGAKVKVRDTKSQKMKLGHWSINWNKAGVWREVGL